MHTEYEIRILDINKEEMIEKLEKLGAKENGVYFQRRYVYDLKPAHKSKWIRLRTNGKKATLAYKNVEANQIDGTKEVEFEVDNFDIANEFLEKIGFQSKAYQENERIQYILNGVEIDIDTWPLIPTYMEIEGKSSDEVLKIKDLLGINDDKIVTLSCEDIYKEFYGIDMTKIKELKL